MNALRIALLAALWCLLTREASIANVALGTVVATLLLRLVTGPAQDLAILPAEANDDLGETADGSETAPRKPSSRWMRPLYAVELAGFFLYELLLSNVRLAVLLLGPSKAVRAYVIDVPVSVRSEAELAVLSDLVTLTPGTLTLDVSPDSRTMHVHVLTSGDPEAVRADIRDGLAPRVRRLFA